MNRRQVFQSGVALSVLLAGCMNWDDTASEHPDSIGTASNQGSEPNRKTDRYPEDQRSRIEPQSFEGTGDEIVQEKDVDLEGGLTVVDATHDGDSDFLVGFYRGMNDAGFRLVTANGAYDGETAAIVDGGWLEIQANGDWSVDVRQPRATSGADLPEAYTAEGDRVLGPFEFDGTHSISGTFRGESAFRVKLYSSNAYVETVFDESGAFEGKTTVTHDRPGWVAIEGDGKWSLTLE